MTSFNKFLKMGFTGLAIVAIMFLSATSLRSQDSTSSITAIDWNTDGSRIAVARSDGTLAILDTSSDTSLFSYGPLDLGINSIAWNPKLQDEIAIADGLGIVTLIDFSKTPPAFTFTDAVNTVDDIAWSPDGKILAGAVRETMPPGEATIHLWDGITGGLTDHFRVYDDVLSRIRWSPDNSLIAGGSVDGKVVIWDAPRDIQTAILSAPDRFEEGNSYVNALSWGPDSRYLVTASNFGYPPQSDLGIWDVESNRLVANYSRAFVQSVEWHPAGDQIAFTEGNTVQVIDTHSGKIIATLQSSGLVDALAWSPDGNYLAYAGQTGTISVVKVSEFISPKATESAP